MKPNPVSGVGAPKRSPPPARSVRPRSKPELSLAHDKRARARIPGRKQPVRIVVVDDHRFMRDVITALLRRQETHYQVLADAADAKGAIEACRRLSPDLVLLDINLPDINGIDLVPQIKQVSPQTRVLLCTAYVTDDRILDALHSGADGFAEKTNTWSDFVEVIDRVVRGEHYFCSGTSAALVDAAPGIRKALTPASTVALSSREKEILTLIADGATSKEIAIKLGISVATVDTHRAHLMSKLHIRNVAGLVVFAFRAGLIKLQH